jgi:hypothetical protein
MSNLKDQLIKLGNRNPNLRDHIRPVLQHIVRGKQARQKQARREWIRMRVNDRHFDALPVQDVQDQLDRADKGIARLMSGELPSDPREVVNMVRKVEDIIRDKLSPIKRFAENSKDGSAGNQYDLLHFQVRNSVKAKVHDAFLEKIEQLSLQGDERRADEIEKTIEELSGENVKDQF